MSITFEIIANFIQADIFFALNERGKNLHLAPQRASQVMIKSEILSVLSPKITSYNKLIRNFQC